MVPKKNIVIVGAGGSGSQLARALSAALNPTLYLLTLISSRDYYLHQPGGLRMLTSSKGNLEEDGKVIIPYDRLFLKDVGEFVQAEVTSIVRNTTGSGGKVVTDSGKEYEYTVLVLAPGSLWEGALKFPQLKSDAIVHINEWREKIKKSKGITLIGGGAVGSELAGEIRDIYPDKPITIVHRENHLLSSVYPDKFRAGLEKKLTKRRINLVLGDELTDIPSFPASGVVTKKGTVLDNDLIIPTRGGRPNTAFIASLGEGVLTADGHVKVTTTLQLRDFPDIFAMGDVLDWAEVKQVAKYGKHVTTVLGNLMSVLEGKNAPTRYKSMFEAILISNGIGGGASYLKVLWGIRLGDKLTKSIKSEDLFIKRTAGMLGY